MDVGRFPVPDMHPTNRVYVSYINNINTTKHNTTMYFHYTKQINNVCH